MGYRGWYCTSQTLHKITGEGQHMSTRQHKKETFTSLYHKDHLSTPLAHDRRLLWQKTTRQSRMGKRISSNGIVGGILTRKRRVNKGKAAALVTGRSPVLDSDPCRTHRTQ